MVNRFIKLKPLRSKEFMSFAHDTKPARCCVCQERQFVQLHHFGSGGGMSMKPSDYQVARVCLDCHMKFDMKESSLLKSGHDDVLLAMTRDALELHELWFRSLEDTSGKKMMLRCRSCDHQSRGKCCATMKHVEPPSECALDDLTEMLLSMSPDDVDAARKWFMEWSNRRSANVLSFSLESFTEIISSDNPRVMKFIASQALKVAGVEGIE